VRYWIIKRNFQRRDDTPKFVSLILYVKLLKVGVIFIDMSATWRYSYVSTTFGTGCRTVASPSTSRRNRYVRKPEKEIQKPQREQNSGSQHLVVLWFLSWIRSEGRVTNSGILATLLNEGCGLSLRNDIMHYRLFFGSVLDYAGLDLCYVYTCLQDAGGRAKGFRICWIVMLVTRKFTRIWSTNFPPNTTEHWPSY